MSVRTALVSGSSSGIGRAIAQTLLDEGWVVVGLARDHGKFRPESDGYHPETIDLADLDGLPAVLDGLARRFEFDAIISNAGSGTFGGLESYSARQIRDYLDANLVSHLLVARAFLPGLKTRGGGDFVVMGSESALQGARKGSLYCTAKFGLRGLAQSLRAEGGPRGVRVTLINPGMVRTPFFDGLGFAPGDDESNALEAADVAETVQMVLNARPGAVFDEINLTPLKKVLQFD